MKSGVELKPLNLLVYIFSGQLFVLMLISLFTGQPIVLVTRLRIQNDFWDIYVGVNAFLRHLDPYLGMRLYAPPSSLLTALPFFFLPYIPASILFLCFNVASVLGALFFFCRHIGLTEDETRRMQLLAIMYFPFHFVIARGNIDGIVASLIMLSFCDGSVCGRSGTLGLAIGFKMYPGILLVSFARQRKFLLIASVLLVLVIMQAPFTHIEGSFFRAVLGRAGKFDMFENVSPVVLFRLIFGPSLAKLIFVAFWVVTLAVRCARDRSEVSPELWVDYVPWMISMPFLIYPYEYVLLLPFIAVFSKRIREQSVGRVESFAFTGFILTGFPCFAFGSAVGDQSYGLQLINIAGLVIILVAVTFAPRIRDLPTT